MENSRSRWGRRWAASLLRLLFLAGITAGLAFLIFRGMGWRGPQGVSDALFVVALGEIVVAGSTVWGTVSSTSGDLPLRVLAGMHDKQGSTEHQQTILADMLQRQKVAVQALACGFATMLISVAVSLLWK